MLDDFDLDLDDEAMKGLFARKTEKTTKAKPTKAAAASKKESVLDGKRLHLVSIALKSAKMDQELVIAAIQSLNRAGVPPSVMEVRCLV